MQQREKTKTTTVVDHGNNDNTIAEADAWSVGSFPILSPNHKFDDASVIVGGDDDEAGAVDRIYDADAHGGGSKNVDDRRADGSSKKGVDRGDDDAVSVPMADDNLDRSSIGTSSQDTTVHLRRKAAEIRSIRDKLAKDIAKKAHIKGTLINAIDGNLERNMRRIKSLDLELEEIQLRTMKTTAKRGRPVKNDAVMAGRFGRSPIGAYDRLASFDDDADDPGITADTDSVADLYRREGFERRGGATSATGLDPPARRSPPTIEEVDNDSRVDMVRHMEPDGSRISIVRQDDDDVDRWGGRLMGSGGCVRSKGGTSRRSAAAGEGVETSGSSDYGDIL